MNILRTFCGLKGLQLWSRRPQRTDVKAVPFVAAEVGGRRSVFECSWAVGRRDPGWSRSGAVTDSLPPSGRVFIQGQGLNPEQPAPASMTATSLIRPPEVGTTPRPGMRSRRKNGGARHRQAYPGAAGPSCCGRRAREAVVKAEIQGWPLDVNGTGEAPVSSGCEGDRGRR